MKKFYPFILVIFALTGIIFTYEWMYWGRNFFDFPKILVSHPKLITWLILMVVKTTAYFVLFPILLFDLYESRGILKKKDYLIFTITIITLLELLMTWYGSSQFDYLRTANFAGEAQDFVRRQNLIGRMWGVISGLLFTLIFQFPFKLNDAADEYETKLKQANDQAEKTNITVQTIKKIAELKRQADNYFYLLGFIVSLSELSFAALREAAIAGKSPSFFPIEVVYYHGLLQSLLIAAIYIPFSVYFKKKSLSILNYIEDNEDYKELQPVTEFKLNFIGLKKAIPIISPLIGAVIPALVDKIFG